MRLAIIAHYDTASGFSEDFRNSVANLFDVVDRIIVVSTSSSEDLNLLNVECIHRPNIGYDFYSYRVGFDHAMKFRDYFDSLIFINSSFFVTDPVKFTKLCRKIFQKLTHNDIVAFTKSFQIVPHYQSYIFGVSLSDRFTDVLIEYFSKIIPCDTKLEYIFNYEFALINLSNRNDFVYSPRLSNLTISAIKWVFDKRNLSWKSPLRKFASCLSFNPAEFYFQDILNRYGIIKKEVLRSFSKRNINESFLADHPYLLEYIRTSKDHYKKIDNGLNILSFSSLLPHFERLVVRDSGSQGHIAVFVHLYYSELLPEIRSYLNEIPVPYDLFITTPHHSQLYYINSQLPDDARNVFIFVSENRGRDVGPFLSVYLNGFLDRYDAVLKLHGKMSKYSEYGEHWRRSIYKSLLSDPVRINRIISAITYCAAGIVGPKDFLLTNRNNFMGANESRLVSLLEELNIRVDADKLIRFFAGTMFWFKPIAFQAIKAIPIDQLLFEAENGQQDGTLAHTIERIFIHIVISSGYKVHCTHDLDGDLNTIDLNFNRVPVL